MTEKEQLQKKIKELESEKELLELRQRVNQLQLDIEQLKNPVPYQFDQGWRGDHWLTYPLKITCKGE